MRVHTETMQMVEINFLCVHKKLRSKRLAPVLIKEITRRTNVQGVFQAVYTAGVVLPKPVAECRYWHRSLNPKKLVDIGFSRIAERQTMARLVKLYRLPDKPSTYGLRPMTPEDVPSACKLLNNYLQK
jgi:glycylpeptide N-tetradecanoyltransferase